MLIGESWPKWLINLIEFLKIKSFLDWTRVAGDEVNSFSS